VNTLGQFAVVAFFFGAVGVAFWLAVTPAFSTFAFALNANQTYNVAALVALALPVVFVALFLSVCVLAVAARR
jgi:hypothetical protein